MSGHAKRGSPVAACDAKAMVPLRFETEVGMPTLAALLRRMRARPRAFDDETALPSADKDPKLERLAKLRSH